MVDITYEPVFPEGIEGRDDMYRFLTQELNRGASVPALNRIFTHLPWFDATDDINSSPMRAMDLTGDGVNEIVFLQRIRGVRIFTCMNGGYKTALYEYAFYGRHIEDLIIEDMNRNGIPEVLFRIKSDPLHGAYYLYIYEWVAGDQFRNLVITREEDFNDPNYPGALGMGQCTKISISHLQASGTKDIVIRGIPCGFGEWQDVGPWRWYTKTLTWNGEGFISHPEQLDPPAYRFQAAQDGDRAFWNRDYETAMGLYRRVLDDLSLLGWSEELYMQQGEALAAIQLGTATLTPAPADPNEHKVLSAYARYRIILTHNAQGNLDQAEAEYTALLRDYASGQPGQQYAVLASVFWNSYGNTGDLAYACSAAREYAIDHDRDIFWPIDFIWHGWQSPGYTGTPNHLQNICPFE